MVSYLVLCSLSYTAMQCPEQGRGRLENEIRQHSPKNYCNIFWQGGSSGAGIKDFGLSNVKTSAQISEQSG